MADSGIRVEPSENLIMDVEKMFGQGAVLLEV